MSTLLLRFAGPMQSWGSDSRFDVRKTNREPTKSGVIGFMASALGMRRDEPLDRLDALSFGLRVDREGVLLCDLHTAKNEKTSYLTRRYYLCDAVFLVGLYSPNDELMRTLQHAVENPQHPLFLGRRSCPPEGRVCLGLRDMPLLDALKGEPCLVNKTQNKSRIVFDDPLGKARIMDLPESFSPMNRQYTYRPVSEKWISLAEQAEHDPMQELR